MLILSGLLDGLGLGLLFLEGVVFFDSMDWFSFWFRRFMVY